MTLKLKQSMEERLEKVMDKYIDSNSHFDMVDGYIPLVDFITSEIRQAQEEERKKITRELIRIEKDKWKNAKHCTCLQFAIYKVKETLKKSIKK